MVVYTVSTRFKGWTRGLKVCGLGISVTYCKIWGGLGYRFWASGLRV